MLSRMDIATSIRRTSISSIRSDLHMLSDLIYIFVEVHWHMKMKPRLARELKHPVFPAKKSGLLPSKFYMLPRSSF